MSEKELRNIASRCKNILPAGCGVLQNDIAEALADEPDAAKTLRLLEEYANNEWERGDHDGGERWDALIVAQENIAEALHIRLTETGWEWAE